MKYLIYRRLQRIEKYLKEYDYKINKKLDFSSFYDPFYLRPIFYTTVPSQMYYLPEDYALIYSYGEITLSLCGINLITFNIFEDQFTLLDVGFYYKPAVHSYSEIKL